MSETQSSDVVALIEASLATLQPELVELYDESGEHVGHAGAREGGHYQLLIVSRKFEGQTAIARHRLVYQALDTLMKTRIHALAISALTPAELEKVLPS
ncbi:MAG: BolA family protein [Betaproteobacteria bacterium]